MILTGERTTLPFLPRVFVSAFLAGAALVFLANFSSPSAASEDFLFVGFLGCAAFLGFTGAGCSASEGSPSSAYTVVVSIRSGGCNCGNAPSRSPMPA